MPKLPDRWLEYKPIGSRINGTRFIAFKVPLSKKFNTKLLANERFTPDIVLEKIPNLKLVIDLTNTNRYYNKEEFTSHGVKYEKIMCPGQLLPPQKLVYRFFTIVDEFNLDSGQKDGLIGIHCTHGVNRTGYFIGRYMIQRMGFNFNKAIRCIESARGYKIERENYINDLKIQMPIPSTVTSSGKKKFENSKDKLNKNNVDKLNNSNDEISRNRKSSPTSVDNFKGPGGKISKNIDSSLKVNNRSYGGGMEKRIPNKRATISPDRFRDRQHQDGGIRWGRESPSRHNESRWGSSVLKRENVERNLSGKNDGIAQIFDRGEGPKRNYLAGPSHAVDTFQEFRSNELPLRIEAGFQHHNSSNWELNNPEVPPFRHHHEHGNPNGDGTKRYPFTEMPFKRTTGDISGGTDLFPSEASHLQEHHPFGGYLQGTPALGLYNSQHEGFQQFDNCNLPPSNLPPKEFDSRLAPPVFDKWEKKRTSPKAESELIPRAPALYEFFQEPVKPGRGLKRSYSPPEQRHSDGRKLFKTSPGREQSAIPWENMVRQQNDGQKFSSSGRNSPDRIRQHGRMSPLSSGGNYMRGTSSTRIHHGYTSPPRDLHNLGGRLSPWREPCQGGTPPSDLMHFEGRISPARMKQQMNTRLRENDGRRITPPPPVIPQRNIPSPNAEYGNRMPPGKMGRQARRPNTGRLNVRDRLSPPLGFSPRVRSSSPSTGPHQRMMSPFRQRPPENFMFQNKELMHGNYHHDLPPNINHNRMLLDDGYQQRSSSPMITGHRTSPSKVFPYSHVSPTRLSTIQGRLSPGQFPAGCSGLPSPGNVPPTWTGSPPRRISPLMRRSNISPRRALSPPRKDFSMQRKGMTSPRRAMSPPRQGVLSPSRRGTMSPRRGMSPQRRGVSPPRRGVSPPRRGLSPPRRGISPQRRGMSPHRRGMSPPRRCVSPPRRGMSPSRRGMSPQRRGVSPARRGISPPRRGMSPPRRGLSPPRRGMSPPRRGMSPPRRGMSPPRRGMSPPRRGLSPPRRGLSLPRRGLSPSRRGMSPFRGRTGNDWHELSPTRLNLPSRRGISPMRGEIPPQRRAMSPLRRLPSPNRSYCHSRDDSPGRVNFFSGHERRTSLTPPKNVSNLMRDGIDGRMERFSPARNSRSIIRDGGSFQKESSYHPSDLTKAEQGMGFLNDAMPPSKDNEGGLHTGVHHENVRPSMSLRDIPKEVDLLDLVGIRRDSREQKRQTHLKNPGLRQNRNRHF